jgi:eukaryotic-like serine/threonine-protein kinase
MVLMASQATPSDWRAAEAVLDRLLDLEPEQRLQALRDLTTPGPVRECAEQLLTWLDRPGLLDQGELQLGATPHDCPNLTGCIIDRYRLEAAIGHGGMSAVYRARRIDDAYEEPVAIKLLAPALLSTRWSEQFRREVRFLSGLRHPNIASLLDAGVADDGTPWLVTEYIDGTPIDEWCKPSVTIRERVTLVRDLCRAVAFAQANLIVHRDIKPDNVLVTADRRVVLLDFGIARALDAAKPDIEAIPLTRVFTPQYAAPEQLTGHAITTATDVFAIGAVLYRLLTGVAPFGAAMTRPGTGSTELPSRRLGDNPDLSPNERRQLCQVLRGDLDNIVGKALATEPTDRYRNAEQFGDDLEAWLNYRAVRARRPSIRGRLRLFCLRRTALATTLAALMVVTVAGLLGTLWQAHEARLQARTAEQVSNYLASVFLASDPVVGEGEDPPVSEILQHGSAQALEMLSDQPHVAAELLQILGSVQRRLGFFEDAEVTLATTLEAMSGRRKSKQAWAGTMTEYGLLAHDLGHYEISLERMEAALAAWPGGQRSSDPRRLEAELIRTQLQVFTEPALALEALPMLRETGADAQLDTELRIKALRTLAMVLGSNDGDRREHREAVAQALNLAQSLPVGRPTVRSELLVELGLIELDLGHYGAAESRFGEALEIERQRFGDGHPRLAPILANRGFSRFYTDQPKAALEDFSQAVAVLPPEHGALAAYRARLAAPFWALGDDQALRHLALESLDVQLSAAAQAFVQAHYVQLLLDREEAALAWQHLQRLEELAVLESLPPERWRLFHALSVQALLGAGDTASARILADGLGAPDGVPAGYIDQWTALACIHALTGLDMRDAAEPWQRSLEQAGTAMPVAHRLTRLPP